MSSRDTALPGLVPMLSRGKHRSPRKGACFMEMASYLAGERWSDHPACTHPLLAAVARLVNDHTSDTSRSELVPLVPSVIGLTDDDPRLDVRIALRCATIALPVVAEMRQRILAVSILAAEQALAELDGRPLEPGAPATSVLQPRSRAALAAAPGAAAWAARFRREIQPPTAKGFRRHGAPTAVRHAVVGVAQACIPDPDMLLRELLRASIEECTPERGRESRSRSRTSPVLAAR